MDEQRRTVRYVTRDPIQNLKIKVTLIRLSALRTKTKLHKPTEQCSGRDVERLGSNATAAKQGQA
jgi:hypothetical protein